MRKIALSCFAVMILLSSSAQTNLSPFENLIGSKWETKGNWSNGEEFRQEYIFEWSLNKTLVKVQTFGTTNMLTKEFGLRNEGIRFWQESEKQVKFYEFDVFGGITEGICRLDGNSMNYEYQYGDAFLRESWTYQDQDTYQYKIVTLEDGKEKEVYLTTEIRRLN